MNMSDATQGPDQLWVALKMERDHESQNVGSSQKQGNEDLSPTPQGAKFSQQPE